MKKHWIMEDNLLCDLQLLEFEHKIVWNQEIVSLYLASSCGNLKNFYNETQDRYQTFLHIFQSKLDEDSILRIQLFLFVS